MHNLSFLTTHNMPVSYNIIKILLKIIAGYNNQLNGILYINFKTVLLSV